ncbi:helix-turn-helix domain-containing protein [Macrococcus bovicus]|uniref:XRE family transcriptional regulator n=1 Tax=Macrococcus bovicus TaxID=69968 RepID=A0A4R6C2Y2_9STAP|nr:XRE family transcriptional regulator [Macrococcus bovicus]
MSKENHLKSLMEKKSGSVKAFAEEINLPYTTVRSILERGIMNAKVENVIKICKGLNIKTEDVLNIDNSSAEDFHDNQTVEVIAAHIDDDATEEEIEEILAYIEMRKSLRKNRK